MKRPNRGGSTGTAPGWQNIRADILQAEADGEQKSSTIDESMAVKDERPKTVFKLEEVNLALNSELVSTIEWNAKTESFTILSIPFLMRDKEKKRTRHICGFIHRGVLAEFEKLVLQIKTDTFLSLPSNVKINSRFLKKNDFLNLYLMDFLQNQENFFLEEYLKIHKSERENFKIKKNESILFDHESKDVEFTSKILPRGLNTVQVNFFCPVLTCDLLDQYLQKLNAEHKFQGLEKIHPNVIINLVLINAVNKGIAPKYLNQYIRKFPKISDS